MFNWFALDHFFALYFGALVVSPGAAYEEGLSIPTTAARAEYNLAERHFSVGGVAFNGEEIIVWNALETELSRSDAGEDKDAEVRGSYSETVFSVRDVDCDRVRGFYRGGEHHSMGMDEGEEEEDYDFDWSQHPFAPWAEDYDYGGYPGTRGCEATCEGYNFTSRETCETDERFFCEWNMGKCWSAVGDEDCPGDAHQMEQMLADMEAWDGGHRSAREMNYRGVWPTKSAMRKARDECESVKDALMSAGSAEQTDSRVHSPTALGRRYPGGCPRRPMQPGVSQKRVPLRLSSLGLALLGLMLVIIFVNLICFGHYARAFPDMRGGKFDSVMFAIGLPVMVARHDFVGVGRVEFSRDRALGFRYHRVRLGDTPRRGGMSVRRRVCALGGGGRSPWDAVARETRPMVATGARKRSPAPGGAKGVPLRHAA